MYRVKVVGKNNPPADRTFNRVLHYTAKRISEVTASGREIVVRYASDSSTTNYGSDVAVVVGDFMHYLVENTNI